MANWPSLLRLFLATISLIGLVGQVQAQLPPDERRQLRQEMRDHWRQLPPEERQRFRQEREERRELLQQMPAEDRSRLRDELRGQRDGRGGGHGFEHRGGGRH